MYRKNKTGYVSLEVMIICAVILTAGIGGITTFTKNGQSNQATMVEKQEEVYQSAWNGNQGGTENNIGGNIVKTETVTLIDGVSFNSLIPDNTTKIIFTDIDAPNGKTLTDVSEEKNNSIVSWSEGTTYYVSTQDKKVQIMANTKCNQMFLNKANVSYINVQQLDVRNTETMDAMFKGTGKNAETFEIDGLNTWDVSSVTNMHEMFDGSGYNALVWDIGSLKDWNTSSVTTITRMFNGAGYSAQEISLQLDNWNVGNVIHMNGAFNRMGYIAKKWSIGDLSDWDISSCITTGYMFQHSGRQAESFSLGDLSNWNVTNVLYMMGMFEDSGRFSDSWYIGNIGEWDVSNAIDMGSMMRGAGLAKANYTLDLSKWDVKKVTQHGYFSEGTKIIPPNWIENN